jgi:hypothetical protein
MIDIPQADGALMHLGGALGLCLRITTLSVVSQLFLF